MVVVTRDDDDDGGFDNGDVDDDGIGESNSVFLSYFYAHLFFLSNLSHLL